MSFEQRVAQLQQTNRKLTEEMIRVRNGALGLGRMYGSVSDGVDAVGDDEYFVVAGGGTYQRLYRRSGSSANFIAEYPSTDATEQTINNAKDSAEGRIAEATERAEAYGPKLGFVSRERLRREATLDLDFAAGEYRLEDGDTLETTDASEILTVERASPKWVMGPNGKLREVPPDTLAREWKDGKCQGVLIEESRSNLLRWSKDFTEDSSLSAWQRAGVTVSTDFLAAGMPLSDISSVAGERDFYFVQQRSFDVVGGESYAIQWFFKEREFVPILRLGGVFSEDRAVINTDRDGLHTNSSMQSISSSAKVLSIGGGFLCSIVVTAPESGEVTLRFAIGEAGSTQYVRDTAVGHGFWLGFVQFEKGPAPSSYIPTEDAPVTRAADHVSAASMAGIHNQDHGTIVSIATFKKNETGSHPNLWRASGNPRVRLEINGGHGRVILDLRGIESGFNSTGFWLDEGQNVVVVSYSEKTAKVSYRGEVWSMESDQAIGPYTEEGLNIGRNGSRNYWNSDIQAFYYFPRALSEEEMIALTTPEE